MSGLFRSLVRSTGTQTALDGTLFNQVRFATKRAGGTAKNNKDSPGQRLGIKRSGGQAIKTGQIIVRQRGTVWHAGQHVGMGRDHTLFALQPGFVKYYKDPAFPRRQFVGIVYDRAHTLPADPTEPRIRRLGFYDAKTVKIPPREGVSA
ncbi:54S ribosomal protein L2 mitochondrial [Savitreella phatthalungensis]